MQAADRVRISVASLLVPFAHAAFAGDSCSTAAHANIGCEFYAVALPNAYLDRGAFSFGVHLLNASGSGVDVTATGGGLLSQQVTHVGAGSSATATLPWVSGLSTSSATTIFTGAAFHLQSTGPVTAAQFNSIGGTGTQTNDASLLLPVRSAGTSFRVIGWPAWYDGVSGNNPGQLAIVATADSSSVTITAAATLQAGSGAASALTSSGGTVMLNQGDVLLVSSLSATGGASFGPDWSGTQVTSSAPVLVWASHAGTEIPASTGYADHLEEMLPPSAALGTDYYVAVPVNPASGTLSGARAFVKIVADADAQLTFDPSVGAPASLSAGQTALFEATGDVHVTSTAPIIVAQFMEGASQFGVNGIGDPSQLITLPISHAQRAIDFAAPSALSGLYAQLIAPLGATIKVDGTTVTGWQQIGSSSHASANWFVGSGNIHHAAGDEPFLLSVYDYPSDDANSTSYWWPGSFGDDVFADAFE